MYSRALTYRQLLFTTCLTRRLPGAYSGIDLNMRDDVFQFSPTSSSWQTQTVTLPSSAVWHLRRASVVWTCHANDVLEAKQVQRA